MTTLHYFFIFYFGTTPYRWYTYRNKFGHINMTKMAQSRTLLNLRDNYSKPPWGLAPLHFVYPWFKTYHFAPPVLQSDTPPLPTWPLDVSLTPFYSKLEHITDQTTKIHSLFFTSPRNTKIIVTELGFWFFWSCFRVRVRFWLWVVLRHWIFEDRSSPGMTFLHWGFKFWAGVSSFDGSFDNWCLLRVEIT